MPRGKPNVPLERGAVFGTWTVLRASSPASTGQERWLCRSSCCGREKVMLRKNIHHAPAACNKCTPAALAKAAA